MTVSVGTIEEDDDVTFSMLISIFLDFLLMNLSIGWQLVGNATIGEATAEFEGTNADAGDAFVCLLCFDLDLIDDGVVSPFIVISY